MQFHNDSLLCVDQCISHAIQVFAVQCGVGAAYVSSGVVYLFSVELSAELATAGQQAKMNTMNQSLSAW